PAAHGASPPPRLGAPPRRSSARRAALGAPPRRAARARSGPPPPRRGKFSPARYPPPPLRDLLLERSIGESRHAIRAFTQIPRRARSTTCHCCRWAATCARPSLVIR